MGGTQDKYRVFIENCHVHVGRIVAALVGAAPPTRLPLAATGELMGECRLRFGVTREGAKPLAGEHPSYAKLSKNRLAGSCLTRSTGLMIVPSPRAGNVLRRVAARPVDSRRQAFL